jgi:hypothetical protein
LPNEDRKLTTFDRQLADRRARAVEDFIKNELGIPATIDTYNMAESSNWLARTLNTRDAALKATVTKQTATPASHPEFQLIRDTGGPSRAVIVIDSLVTLAIFETDHAPARRVF